LKPGMRICQLIFEQTLGTPQRGYQGQFSGQSSPK
jgi:dCTP deaminase